ncbi:PH domain-containing protein [Nocardia sp. NPDC005978]|uniref:PH domain-containing protein n=1 Tax=Nocardia sp. NPDC005978 TaxID=3156725 RepID=UPI0033A5A6F1
MPVVRIWKRDGGSDEPPREPAAQSKDGAAEVPASEPKSSTTAAAESEPAPGGGAADAGATAVSGAAGTRSQSPGSAPAPSAQSPDGDWDLVVRPHRSVRTAWIVAVFLAVFFTVMGVFLRRGSTGVTFQVSDQIGLAVFGFILGGAVLLLTRPRVRVGRRGVEVRNIFGENEFAWPDIRGLSFPDKKSWARLELVHDEYVPLLAIRTNDKLLAADAMDRFRELGAKYTGENQG